jgi:hypothetical protein
MRRRDVIGLFGVALALAGCGRGNSWHQKLTVIVSTPNGDVSGSAVTRVELNFAEDSWLAPGYAYSGTISGEAVVVEIAPRRYVFAILEENQKLLALKTFISSTAAGSPRKQDANLIETLRSRKPIPFGDYPMLVTFTDINNPKTVKEVKPHEIVELFGAGYQLKSIDLEITDEPVSSSIRKFLPWFDGFIGKRFDGSKIHLASNPNLSHHLSSSSFKIGLQ